MQHKPVVRYRSTIVATQAGMYNAHPQPWNSPESLCRGDFTPDGARCIWRGHRGRRQTSMHIQ